MQKIIIFFIFICTFSISYAEDKIENKKETITIVADTWCPYNCNPKSPHKGFMVDIAKQAFAKHDIEVIYSVVPWTRAIEETRKGLHTAIIGSAHGDAPDFIFPDVPQGFLQNHFYVKKAGKWRYDGINSLKNIILGIIADYSYNDELDNYIKKYKLDPNKISMMSGDDALGINLSKLKRDKINAIIEAQYVMDYYLSMNNMKNDVEDVGILPPSKEDFLYIAFSPKDKKLARKYAAILTDETKNMRASGQLKKIMATYGLEDWEKPTEKLSENSTGK